MKNVTVNAGFLIIEKVAMIKFKTIENVKVVDDTISELPIVQEKQGSVFSGVNIDADNPQEEDIIGVAIEHTNGIEFFETETVDEAIELFQKIVNAVTGE